jgi:soluble lytic murein transglycosylase-like protein
MRTHAWVGVLLVFATLPGCAESVQLKTGYRIAVDSHETDGNVVHLFLPGGGSADVLTADVESYIPDPPPPPKDNAPVAPQTKPADEPKPVTLDELIRSSSARHGLDPDLIRSMITTESAGNSRAVSPKGAAGLMQLMPGTARILGVENPFDPGANVEAGTAYIRQLLERYGHDLILALAAYNAGPGKVEQYKGLPPYRETDAYVRRVITLFNKQKTKQQALAQ